MIVRYSIYTHLKKAIGVELNNSVDCTLNNNEIYGIKIVSKSFSFAIAMNLVSADNIDIVANMIDSIFSSSTDTSFGIVMDDDSSDNEVTSNLFLGGGYTFAC